MLQAEIITRPYTDMAQSETLLSFLMLIFYLFERVKKKDSHSAPPKAAITCPLAYIPFNFRISLRMRNKSHF
jgi:hypothetical protein